MIRKVWLLCLVCFPVVVLAQEERMTIFALSRTPPDPDPVTSLHTVDFQTGAPTLVGETGFGFCYGLHHEDGALYSLCLEEDVYHLTRLDPETGRGELLSPVLPAMQQVANGTQFNTPSDFLLTADRIGVISTLLIDSSLPGLPAQDRVFEVYDRRTLDLLARAPTFAVALSGEVLGDQASAVLEEFGDIVLGQLSLQTAQRQISFPLSYRVRDLARLPATRRFLALGISPPANQVLFLGHIDEEFEVSVPVVSVPFNLEHLTVVERGEVQPPETPDLPEYVFPILEAQPGSTGSFSTHITLLNAVGTADAPFILEVFDSEGHPIDPTDLYCPGPGQEDLLRQPVAGQHLRGLDLTGGVVPVSGWARLRAADALSASSEVIFTTRTDTGCGALATSLPSQDIQTTVQVPPVRPVRRWVAEGVINPNRESAFSLVNPDLLQSSLVTVTALDAEGNTVDINEIELQPGERISNLLFELLIRGKVFLLPPERPQDYRGSILIESDLPIAVAGLTVLLPEG
ncbi:MAG TPA: hypothetical protein VLU25_10215, partial [Acidobacteriota bacterium]|nr:hypothetical protein [Acidobacteriota bacterium]